MVPDLEFVGMLSRAILVLSGRIKAKVLIVIELGSAAVDFASKTTTDEAPNGSERPGGVECRLRRRPVLKYSKGS